MTYAPHRRRLATAALLAGLLSACAPAIQRTTLPAEWIPSPNLNERRANFVILHHTGSATRERALHSLTDKGREVSAHYLIDRDGSLIQLVDERARAWHAGDSYWGGQRDLNSASIGIELVNDGTGPFPDAQVDALLALLGDLRERLKIPAANVLGHGDIAPGRKVDPSVRFPWPRLAAAGFGLWCAPPLGGPETIPGPGVGAMPPDDAVRLAAFGYDTQDLGAAVRAFRRHFTGRDEPRETLTPTESRQLDCLLEARRWSAP